MNLSPDALADTPMGRALLSSRLVATVVDFDRHITVKAVCKAKIGGRWQFANFTEATHVFLTVPAADGGFPDRIGTYYPSGKYEGCFFSDRAADASRVEAASYVLNACAGRNNGSKLMMESFCFRCGKPLTEPESIKLGFGPTCLPHAQSAHQTKVKRSGDGEGTPEQKTTGFIPKGTDENVRDWTEAVERKSQDEQTTEAPLYTLRKGESARDKLAAL